MQLDQAIEGLIAAGRRLDDLGWAPAGSGNYSQRLADGRIAITVSGAHKGRLTEADIMTLDARGRPEGPQRPSAETALHRMLYRRDPEAMAVLHTHSIAAVVLSRRLACNALTLAGYELLKAYPGVDTHEARVDLPILDNSQDMDALAMEAEAALNSVRAPAFLVRGHGLYGWGRSLDEALAVVEASETLLACELETLRMGGRR